MCLLILMKIILLYYLENRTIVFFSLLFRAGHQQTKFLLAPFQTCFFIEINIVVVIIIVLIH